MDPIDELNGNGEVLQDVLDEELMTKSKRAKAHLANGFKDNKAEQREMNGSCSKKENSTDGILEPRTQKLHLGFADCSQSQPVLAAANGDCLGFQELS